MSDIKLGQLITGPANRDAIHIAVAPVEAAQSLAPGTHIGFAIDGNAELVTHSEAKSGFIGIVDPFLGDYVKPGQKFWMFLYPQTITSLRHDWTHPAFPLNSPIQHDDKAYSERWLREYAERVNSNLDPQDAFNHLIDGLRNREVYYRGTDMHGFSDLEQPAELRRHAETYLGIKINWSDYQFTCSC